MRPCIRGIHEGVHLPSLSPHLYFILFLTVLNDKNVHVFITDRKAGDPSQAGADQTDGKLKDSKDRCVSIHSIQSEADCSVAL